MCLCCRESEDRVSFHVVQLSLFSAYFVGVLGGSFKV